MRKLKCLLALAFFIFPAAVSLSQTSPGIVNYQGRLADSSGLPLADGTTVDFTFNLYSVESGDTLLYLSALQEDVVVTGGIYHVLIGSGTVTPGTENTLADVFQKHPEVWMGIRVDADPEMTPRVRISSVPYSLAVDLSAFYSAAAANPDFDDDGYLTALLGGVDCNDGDSAINPEGADLTADGIDQNCSGRDGDNSRVYLFSSQGTYPGDLLSGDGTGRYGADYICRGDKALYPEIPGGHVHGFINTTMSDLTGECWGECICNMPNFYPDEGVPTSLPIVGPTGIKIADNWADLMDGSIDTSLQAAQVLEGYWWSGSNDMGSLEENCDGFTNSGNLRFGIIGDASYANYLWISFGAQSCNNYYKILCIAW